MLLIPEGRSLNVIFPRYISAVGEDRVFFCSIGKLSFLLVRFFSFLSPFLIIVSTAIAGNAATLTLTVTNVTCNGQNNGTISSVLSGGTGGTVNFTLTPGSISNTSGVFNNLTAGSYTVSADDSGNITASTVLVTEPPVSSIPSITLGALSVFCPGASSFALNYTDTNGSPVSFSITAGTPAMPGFVPVVNASLGSSPLTIPLPAAVAKGTYQFQITVMNASGCVSALKTFLLNINDTSSPVWTSFPEDKDVECSSDKSPATTGNPSASDNCGTVTISFTDAVTSGSCTGQYVITRTFKAIDQSGNFITKTQEIHVMDTTPPVINCTNLTVANPSAIPASNLNTGITASDNCGTATIDMVAENYVGMTNAAGFCPTSIERTYVAVDLCGNFSSQCKQTITVQSTGTCKVCQDDVPFLPVIFSKADSTYTSPSIARNGICCNASGPPPPKCISFNIYLHKDAVGLIFKIVSGAIPPGALYYQIDCGPPQPVGEVLCLQGGRFYTLTFCKPGNNANVYSIQSISGMTSTEGLVTRADNKCSGQISVSGIVPSTLSWSVKTPNDQTLLRYLSCTNCLNPIFTPDAQAPASIVYQVCGTLNGTAVCNGNPIVDCKDVTVTVLPAIKIAFNIDPGNICQNNIPVMHAAVSPANLNYSYKWYAGTNGSGALLSSDPFWTPTAEGLYSLIATESQSGVICNTATNNFQIQFDKLGPVVMAPPDTLSLECNDPAAEAKIAAWIATAKASDGSISSIAVSNDYAPFVHTCGLLKNVRFWSSDACSNVSEVTGTIRITDKQAPVFNVAPTPVNVSTDAGLCYATGVPLGIPAVTDNCMVQSVTNDAPTQFPVGNTIVTWTATDGCGNKTTATQTVTVKDNIKPVISCPGNVTQTALPGNCSLDNVIITDPTYSDNCSVTALTWSMSGATTGTSPLTGINSASGKTYNVGITTVTYTATDAAGNQSACTFNVWIKDLQKPVLTTGCPADVVQTTDPLLCTTNVTFLKPVVSDPCNEGFTIVNSFNGTDDASGNYPGGVTNVIWTITDLSGNVTTCTQKITINSLNTPTVTCPANIVQTALPGNCSLSNVVIPSPTINSICPVPTQTWAMTGATTGNSPATGINNVSGQTFNTGITTVTYAITDAGGRTASCSFDVWIKDLIKPVMTSGCPPDVVQTTDPGQCNAVVTVPKPLVSDPCNEGYTIMNNFNNTDNASGTYPVGTTVVVWTITDLSGNSITCSQNITINDRVPSLNCPSNLTAMADFEKMFASNVPVPSPTFGDDCPGLILTWTMTGVTTGSSPSSGVNIFPATSTFNVGVTTIQYNLEDANGHKVSCSFTVTVEAKPDITCQPDVTKISNAGICNTSLDPGFPVKVSGVEPITYTWTMSGANSGSGTGAITPIPYSFNLGVTSITWTATNISGSDACTQTITVTDTEIPTINIPAPLSFCVENLISAAIVSNLMQLSPTPDYFLFKTGSTALDISSANMSDNCTPANQLVLNWKIDFSLSTPTPSISGTGQPSAYSSDIIFPGDGSTYNDVTHTITYWVVDLSGNESVHKSVTITIHPRPVVSYHNVPESIYNRFQHKNTKS